MSIARLMQMARAGVPSGGGGIEDVFSTYLYTGNGSTQTITNGIDLAGEGGLVWIKNRFNGHGNFLFDTERGVNKALLTNGTNAQFNEAGGVNAFNPSGFSLNFNDAAFNGTGNSYASWTFRKAPRFFDVVPFTVPSTGTPQTINHNLNGAVGFVITKLTSATSEWYCFHTSRPNQYFRLNGTYTEQSWTWSSDDVSINIGAFWSTTYAGQSGIAYFFAHDPLGPSGDGSDGLIDCGSYTGGGTGVNVTVNLGWEPQWILVKNTSAAGDWYIVDTMRGLTVSADEVVLSPNLSAAEDNKGCYVPTATGFFTDSTAPVNISGNTYIYIAIRRGPMRAPESGTEVFAPYVTTSVSPSGSTTFSTTYDVGFPVDWIFQRNRSGTDGWYAGARLTGNKYLKTETTGAEITSGGIFWDSNIGAWKYSTGYGTYNFRRAPEFFDVVAYTGNGTAGRTVPHNLGVAPEMMIVKGRTNVQNWPVYAAPLGNSTVAFLNLSNAVFTGQDHWNSTTPTSSVFSLGDTSAANQSGQTYIAYLFATLAGVSKVGSYTGNGSSQTINCGFTTGARFILIKRTDSTGDWYVWDTARGIIAGNDPHLSLNTTAAEVTTDDSVDPVSSGFIVNQVAATNINVSAASYIFYAVA